MMMIAIALIGLASAGACCLRRRWIDEQAYADLGRPKGSFPLAEKLAETVLSLPMGAHMKLESVDEVATVIRAVLR